MSSALCFHFLNVQIVDFVSFYHTSTIIIVLANNAGFKHYMCLLIL